MCWSDTVSLNTFLVSIGATLLAYHNRKEMNIGVDNPRQLLFMWSFVFMQLVEYFLWRNNPAKAVGKQRKIVRILSVVAFMLAFSQPLASINRLEYGSTERFYAFATYGVMIALFFILVYPTVNFDTTVASNGHLKWHWLQPTGIQWIVMILWLGLFFYPYLFLNRPLGGLLATVTLIASLYFFHESGTWGSMWCWTANFNSLYILLMILIVYPLRQKLCGL
jgi:hypothetical protein